MAVPTAWAIATGRLVLGLLLLILAAVPDLLDGALAKASGRTSVRGAFFDSVSDRVTDALVLGGVAWYLQNRHGGHAALLPFAVLAASLLISYERAKAESLGFQAKGGLMERAERVVLLCLGLLLAAVGLPGLVPILWVMLGLTLITAGQRFYKVWKQASAPPPATRPEPTVMTQRWRAWREANGWMPRAERYARATRPASAEQRGRQRRRARFERSGRREATVGRRGSRRP